MWNVQVLLPMLACCVPIAFLLYVYIFIKMKSIPRLLPLLPRLRLLLRCHLPLLQPSEAASVGLAFCLFAFFFVASVALALDLAFGDRLLCFIYI